MPSPPKPDVPFIATQLLVYFGTFGAHRFYLRRPITGAVMLAASVAYWFILLRELGFDFTAELGASEWLLFLLLSVPVLDVPYSLFGLTLYAFTDAMSAAREGHQAAASAAPDSAVSTLLLVRLLGFYGWLIVDAVRIRRGQLGPAAQSSDSRRATVFDGSDDR